MRPDALGNAPVPQVLASRARRTPLPRGGHTIALVLDTSVGKDHVNPQLAEVVVHQLIAQLQQALAGPLPP